MSIKASRMLTYNFLRISSPRRSTHTMSPAMTTMQIRQGSVLTPPYGTDGATQEPKVRPGKVHSPFPSAMWDGQPIAS